MPGDKVRVVPNGVDDEFRRGPAAEGDYVLAVGTLEPRKNLPRLVEAARRTDVELRVVGARGWGDVQVEGTASAGSASSATTTSRGSTAARSASPTRRCTRASGFRCSRRWRAVRPWSRLAAPRWRRSPAGPPCWSTRVTRPSSPRGSSGRRLARRARPARARTGACLPLGCDRRCDGERLSRGARVILCRRRRARPPAHRRRDVRARAATGAARGRP